MKKLISILLIALSTLSVSGAFFPSNKNIRVLVVTGGHSYNKETFNEMLNSLGSNYIYQVVEFPAAYEMFNPENRGKYDLMLFYHMWQKITPDQQRVFADCIKSGKPVIALHHSICAFDEWEEYWHILGGKYFHKPTVVDGKEYAACSYIHDMHFTANISVNKHPVTKGVKDFELYDETYKGYWVDPSGKVLITTIEESSTPVIGWTKKYGKAKIVVLQSGHDTPTFQNTAFRQILKQSIEWAAK
jgi:type 1 glutamine amidotransferase